MNPRRELLPVVRRPGPLTVLGRGLVVGGVIVAGQWWVLTHAAQDPRLVWAVLGVPGLVAGVAVARVFTVTGRSRRGGDW